MKNITSYAELEKMIQQQAKQLCEHAANEVYETINFFINQYYSEWTPAIYQRTYDFLHSAFKTNVIQNGKSFVAEVGIDYESLNDYQNATGLEIVTWANSELHGGLNVGTHTRVWDDTIESAITSGQLLKDCIDFLKNKGFTVIT